MLLMLLLPIGFFDRLFAPLLTKKYTRLQSCANNISLCFIVGGTESQPACTDVCCARSLIAFQGTSRLYKSTTTSQTIKATQEHAFNINLKRLIVKLQNKTEVTIPLIF